MGYDLQIVSTRGISEPEWRAYLAGDADLVLTGAAETSAPDGVLRYENPGLAVWRSHPRGTQVWFDFRDGRVVVKNPDEPTVAKMIAVARSLKAHVEGDDGEIYETAGAAPRPPRLSMGTRIRSWFARLRPAPTLEPVVLPFVEGQRVRGLGNQIGTVIAIDLTSNHGLGTVRVRFDDGREVSFMAIAHGLEPVREGSG